MTNQPQGPQRGQQNSPSQGGSNKQVANREQAVMDAFEFEGIKNQLSALLDGDAKKQKAFQTRVLQMSLNSGLKNCSPESIIKCGLQALGLKLALTGGQGYVVSYGGVATLDIGYKGWQVLAKRVGLSVLADVVYNCDEFSQDGYGHDRKMVFKPDYVARQGHIDKWAKENLRGVIVSIKEESTGAKTSAFVDGDMIHKIVGMSLSVGSKHSPHNKWAEQMFAAKAIKQVLSKFPIDLEEAAQLQEAINSATEAEQLAQSGAEAQMNQKPEYDQAKFDENYPKWVGLVKSGKKSAMTIITQFSNGFKLTETQLEKVYELRNHEPIEGETVVEPEQ